MSHLRNRLEESHKDLHQWFLLHQECLLLQNNAFAQQAFTAFTDFLLQHLHFENAFVLPAVQNANMRWNNPVYIKEHEKLEKMLTDITMMLQQYYQLEGREQRLALLDILDREQSFYRVMEHHEQREEQDLFLHLELILPSVVQQWMQVEEGLYKSYDAVKQVIKQFLETA